MYQQLSHITLIQNINFASFAGIFFLALAKIKPCNQLLSFRCFRRGGGGA